MIAESVREPGLHILMVDDSAEITMLLSHFLTRMGHTATIARNGRDALHLLEQRRPDLVLLDVMMPQMDGFETAERIRAMQISGWLPLIFLTADADDASIARGVEVGGDDYLIKPIGFIVLKAKLDAFSRMLAMQRQIAQKNEELEFYYQRAEDEQRISSALMNRMVRVDMLQDPLLKYWIAPAHHISGDLVAAARTPGGILHVLLADGTGHGLAASINVLPVAEPFYDMTAQGYGIAAIIAELNARVKKWLPTERFVAATLVAFNPHERLIEVWAGGNPCPVLLDTQGLLRHQFSRTHLPLGIADWDDFDARTEVLQLDEEWQLALFSDGAVEVANADGVALGREAVLAALSAGAASKGLEHLRQVVQQHLGAVSPQDDISVATIDCKFQDHIGDCAKLAPPAEADVDAGWRAQLHFGAHELRQVNAVPLLLNLVQHLNPRQEHGALFVVITELFNNALDHGVLKLDSRLKSEVDGMERYFALRQSRLAALRSGHIDISLEIVAYQQVPTVAIAVHDSGAGFDYAHFLEAGPRTDLAPHGRGIELVKCLCPQIVYRGCGNEVMAYYRLAIGAGNKAEVQHA